MLKEDEGEEDDDIMQKDIFSNLSQIYHKFHRYQTKYNFVHEKSNIELFGHPWNKNCFQQTYVC